MSSTNNQVQVPSALGVPNAHDRTTSAFSKLPPSGCAKPTIEKRSNEKKSVLTEDRHFLKGINFDNCQDLLSIPSPPSPRSRRHRTSMLVLPPKNRITASPLKDLSNIQDSFVIIATEMLASKNMKSRRSLCHVPSPRVDGSRESIRKHRLESLSNQRRFDVRHSSGQKKDSKRRQSILLPLEIGMDDSNSKATTNPPPNPDVILCSEEAKNTVGSETSFAGMQELVRKFCSLPKGSQESFKHAQLITETAGYSLLLHQSTAEDLSTPEIWHSRRKDVLTKVGPPLEVMEAKKHECSKQAQFSTSCQAERITGKYHYKDKAGNNVSMDEYRLRYLRMVEENKQLKHHEFTVLRQSLESLCTANVDTRLQPQSVGGMASLHTNEVPNHSTEMVGVLDAFEKSSSPCTKKPSSPHTDVMDSILDGMEEVCGKRDVEAESPNCIHSAAFTCDSAGYLHTQSQMDSEGGSISDHEVQSGTKCNKVDLNGKEGSTDPGIDFAERKLWLAIDIALETYSKDVLAIQARRRAAHGTGKIATK